MVSHALLVLRASMLCLQAEAKALLPLCVTGANSGHMQAHHAVPSYPEQYRVDTMSGCLLRFVICLRPPGTECDSGAETGLCEPILCAVACQSFEMAGVVLDEDSSISVSLEAVGYDLLSSIRLGTCLVTSA
jgi:hypothetical protein